MRKSLKMTKVQLKHFRFLRERGLRIGEARKLAKMTTSQLATHLSQQLRKQCEAKSV